MTRAMTVKMTWMWSVGLAIWWMSGAAAWASEPSANEYQTAVKLYKEQKLKQARKLLTNMLPKLQKLQRGAKSAKARHLLSLGQADLYFYLAQIASRQSRPQQACRHYDALLKLMKTLPATWSKWAVQPHLPAQMKQAKQTYTAQCPTLPSKVTFAITPAAASIEYRSKSGPWKRATNQQLQAPAGPLQLKISAKGYKPQQSTLQLKQWEVRKVTLSLKKLPPPPRRRKVAIRRTTPPPPPPPKSVFATWWFWTITGTVVVGATVGVVLFMTLPREFQVGNSDGGTQLW